MNMLLKILEMKKMKEYYKLYLKCDVLLLANVLQKLRSVCLEYYRLDRCHYFSSPELSYDAMLKITNVELELTTDVDINKFIEKGMRGGVSHRARRYG